MLDTRLAHHRHFPAINWNQSYSLHADAATASFDEQHPGWQSLRERCLELLQREEELREVAEVVGMEGLQDDDRLLMRCGRGLRGEFLCQNSFTEDACLAAGSDPRAAGGTAGRPTNGERHAWPPGNRSGEHCCREARDAPG